MRRSVLKVLTLSTLFPNGAEPVLGPFVERQTLGLAAFPDVEVQVISPVGLPPWPLSRHGHYRDRARLPVSERWRGLIVHRPRHPVVPGIGGRWTARLMARSLLSRLKALHQQFPFDVIDAEFFWPDGPAAVALGRALGVPVSIKARGADIRYWGAKRGIGRQIVAAAHAADGLLAVSEGLRGAMIALGMPREKIQVHYTGVDLECFRPVDRAAAKARLGLSGPVIATVGALIPRKNQRLALSALEQLPGATLLIVGEGPDRNMLEAHARGRGLAERVGFLGSRPHTELPAIIAAADVMLLPSLSEGLANAWVEALACGTPVVAGNIDGAREAIDRPAAGRLVPLDADALASAVRAVLDNPPNQAAVRAAAERFSWDRNAAELRDHLLRVSRAA